VREFVDNFCTVSVSFVTVLNRKIRVTKKASIVTVSVFCLLKTASKLKMNPNIILGTKTIFLGRGPAPFTTSFDAYSPRFDSPLLTEILNTPLMGSQYDVLLPGSLPILTLTRSFS